MSPLAKEVIERLSNEEDTELLAEVLDFYEYVKQKKMKKMWEKIEEIEPAEDEAKICSQYRQEEHEFVELDSLVRELGLNE